MTPDYFHGYALNAIDAKSRLSIPANFRDVILARSDTRAVVLAISEYSPCLVGYDSRRSAKLQADLETRFAGDYSPARDAQARLAFGASEHLGMEETGRIILSPTLRDMGELERYAFFLGAGDYFEIWNPQLLLESAGLDPRLARIVRGQLDGKTAAL